MVKGIYILLVVVTGSAPFVGASDGVDRHHHFIMSGESEFVCFAHLVDREVNLPTVYEIPSSVTVRQGIGGACAYVPSYRAFIHVTKDAFYFGPPVSAKWRFMCDSFEWSSDCVVASGTFCGDAWVDVPPGTNGRLEVVVLDVPDPACEPDVEATGGTRVVQGWISIRSD